MSFEDFFTNESSEIVQSQMGYLQQKAEESLVSMNDALEDLRKVITTANAPNIVVDYDYINETIESNLASDKPSIPIFPTIDAFNEDAPTDTFEWHETIDDYQSTLLDAVKSSLLDWIQNGGTGLATEVEEAIFERARMRLTEEWEIAYDNADRFHSSRGFCVPAGPKVAMLRRVNADFERKLEDLNQKIMEVQANLAQNNTQFAHTLSVQLEGQLQNFFNKVTERLFTAAKETVSLLYEIFTQKVNAYVAITEGKKAEITAKSEIVKAQTSVNKGIIDSNVADSQRYKAEIDAVIGVIDGLAKAYASQISGYEADISLEKSNMDARVARLTALMSQSKNESELNLKASEVSLQAYISSLGLNVEVSKTIASILAEIAAGSLSGLNTHVQLSDTTGRRYDEGYRKSYSENHHWNHKT